MFKLIKGDCLEKMKEIPDGSIDMILTDPPYGTTACKWDTVIPLAPMWEQLKRVVKNSGAIVLCGSEPFSSTLRLSNIKNYKYDWVWDKVSKTGGLNSKYQPMRQHELVSIFYAKSPTYNPIKTKGVKWSRAGVAKIDKTTEYYQQSGDVILGKNKSDTSEMKLPSSILKISNADKTRIVHPTQKPVALMEYLVKTYTNEGDAVLDFTMGSGTTGVACGNLGRKFVGIELDEKYFQIATDRIYEAYGGDLLN